MAISITVGDSSRGIVVESQTVAIGNTSAAGLGITSVTGLSATNVQTAIEELAGNNFRQDAVPTGSQVSEGDTWYDKDDNQFKIYRETSSGVFQWVPIIVGQSAGDSDTLDAGSY